jgi:hypothetical protein
VTNRIRKRLWLNSACKDRLCIIDVDRNVTNALGGARAGNPARERVRGSNAMVSERAPKVGCPEKYYSKVWVSNLGSRRMVEALKIKVKKNLGDVQVSTDPVQEQERVCKVVCEYKCAPKVGWRWSQTWKVVRIWTIPNEISGLTRVA